MLSDIADNLAIEIFKLRFQLESGELPWAGNLLKRAAQGSPINGGRFREFPLYRPSYRLHEERERVGFRNWIYWQKQLYSE